jgi:hypothetical protein
MAKPVALKHNKFGMRKRALVLFMRCELGVRKVLGDNVLLGVLGYAFHSESLSESMLLLMQI